MESANSSPKLLRQLRRRKIALSLLRDLFFPNDHRKDFFREGIVSDPSAISRISKLIGQDLIPKVSEFTLSELTEATKDFDRTLKLGYGALGGVFRGKIRHPDGQGSEIDVAIKRLNTGGSQGHAEWFAEILFLGMLEHPNLVKLLGYCGENGQRLLVYEYMHNESLDKHLYGTPVRQALPWITRLKIMLGVAEGIAYLHEGCEIEVIHRDIKPANVLLDEHFNAKFSDLGVARGGPGGDRALMYIMWRQICRRVKSTNENFKAEDFGVATEGQEEDCTHVTTGFAGTTDYAAPEYYREGHLSIRSDIYSFRLVLYEILTGKPIVEKRRGSPDRKLLEWVKQFPADSKNFGEIMDPRLPDQYSLAVARKIAKLADRCLNENARDRPTISQVVEELRQAIQDSEQEGSSAGAP